MTRSILALATSAILAGSLPTQGNPQPERLLAYYPLGGFLVELPRPRRLPVESLLDVRHGFELGEDRHRLFEIDHVMSLVHPLFPRLDDEGFEMVPDENQLVVGGPAADVRELVELFRALERHLTATIEVRAMVIEHDGSLRPPPVLDKAQVRGLLEGHEKEWSGVGHTWSGAPLFLGKHSARAWVESADGEVSEEAKQITPHMSELFEGVSLRVVPHLLSGTSDLAVSVQFARGKLLNMPARDLELAGVPALDVPELQVNCARFSARIPDGGALVFHAFGNPREGGNLVVAVSASYTDPQAGLPKEYLPLPVSALVTQDREFLGDQALQEAYRAVAFEASLDEHETGAPIVDDGRLQDLIRSHVDPASWDGNPCTMSYTRGWMHLTGPEATLKGSAQVVHGLQDLWLQTYVLELDLGGTQDSPSRVVLPVLPGHSHGFRRGVETTRVDGTLTEIAVRSTVELPNVVRMFHGTETRARVEQGGLAPSARIRMRQQRIDWDGGASRRLPPVERADLYRDGALAEHETTEVGTGIAGAVRLTLRHVRAAPTVKLDSPR